MKKIGKRHIVIPDCQVKHGVKTDHLEACGNYIAEKQPDSVICLGDFADMPSLSRWDPKGSMSAEMRRYSKDILAARIGMTILMDPIKAVKGYDPKLILTLGNHEAHITRTIEDDPKLEGVIDLKDLQYEKWGWKVVPFLKPIKVDGVMYSHYFVTGVYDKAIGRASQLLTKYHMSCIAGHQQGRDIAYSKKADGSTITGIIAGSFYEHEEDYLSPQSNNHWRGIYMLNEVRNGSFDEMAVSLNFLKRKYL